MVCLAFLRKSMAGSEIVISAGSSQWYDADDVEDAG